VVQQVENGVGFVTRVTPVGPHATHKTRFGPRIRAKRTRYGSARPPGLVGAIRASDFGEGNPGQFVEQVDQTRRIERKTLQQRSRKRVKNAGESHCRGAGSTDPVRMAVL
jgi:hypothetical protein